MRKRHYRVSGRRRGFTGGHQAIFTGKMDFVLFQTNDLLHNELRVDAAEICRGEGRGKGAAASTRVELSRTPGAVESRVQFGE